jgi:hypothetical protein
MTIGMNAITERNVDEFVLRVTGTEALLGTSLNRLAPGQEPQPRPITAEEVRSHIGLRTNASPKPRPPGAATSRRAPQPPPERVSAGTPPDTYAA